MSCSASVVFRPSERYAQLQKPLCIGNQQLDKLTVSDEKENRIPNKPHKITAIIENHPKKLDPYIKYHEEILDRFQKSCTANRFSEDPFSVQMQVTKRMKRILLNWVTNVHLQFKLKQRTLFLLENILIRYLSSFPVQKKNFQLLGIACLWISSKVEDIYPPELSDLWKIAMNKFSQQEILKAEQEILLSNKFDLIFVSALDIAENLLYMRNITSTEVYLLTSLILEMHLFDGNMGAHDPFELAIFSINFSFKLCNVKERISWKDIQISSSSQENFFNSIRELLLLLRKDKLSALREKYGKIYSYLENICFSKD